jgi:hypothetical protein
MGFDKSMDASRDPEKSECPISNYEYPISKFSVLRSPAFRNSGIALALKSLLGNHAAFHTFDNPCEIRFASFAT